MTFSDLRVKVYGSELFIARDRRYADGRVQPEHLVMRGDKAVWQWHPEGGIMEPFALVQIQRAENLRGDDAT